MGEASTRRVLVVWHTERGDRIRIIGARRHALILNGTDVSDSMTTADGAWTFFGVGGER